MQFHTTPSADTMTTGGEEHSFTENPMRFERVKELLPHQIPQLETAVRDFIVSSNFSPGTDVKGFIEQTRQSIAAATYLGNAGEFWLLTNHDKVMAYVLAHVTKDIDNSLTYWCSQAWVHPELRGDYSIRMAWQKIRERAKNCLCKHIVVVSSRGTAAYCRWLGQGWPVSYTHLRAHETKAKLGCRLLLEKKKRY